MAPSKNDDRDAREARDRLRRYKARQAVHEHGRIRRRRDNIIAILAVVVIATVATSVQLLYFNGGPGTATPAPSATPQPSDSPEPTASPQPTDAATGENTGDIPDLSLAADRSWTGTLTLNDVPLGIELDGSAAPQAVSVVIDGIQNGYYSGKACHRLVDIETAGLLQCGSLDGTGATDPDFQFGPLENTPQDGAYPAGTIAMARGGDNAYSNGRQFFIVTRDTSLPDDSVGGYSIIGTVTTGLDQLTSEVTSAGVDGGGSDGGPVVPTTITGVTIR